MNHSKLQTNVFKRAFSRYGWIALIIMWFLVFKVYYENILYYDVSRQKGIVQFMGKKYAITPWSVLYSGYPEASNYYMVLGKKDKNNQPVSNVPRDAYFTLRKLYIDMNKFHICRLYLYVDLFDSKDELIAKNILLENGYDRIWFSKNPHELITWFDGVEEVKGHDLLQSSAHQKHHYQASIDQDSVISACGDVKRESAKLNCVAETEVSGKH